MNAKTKTEFLQTVSVFGYKKAAEMFSISHGKAVLLANDNNVFSPFAFNQEKKNAEQLNLVNSNIKSDKIKKSKERIKNLEKLIIYNAREGFRYEYFFQEMMSETYKLLNMR